MDKTPERYQADKRLLVTDKPVDEMTREELTKSLQTMFETLSDEQQKELRAFAESLMAYR